MFLNTQIVYYKNRIINKYFDIRNNVLLNGYLAYALTQKYVVIVQVLHYFHQLYLHSIEMFNVCTVPFVI